MLFYRLALIVNFTKRRSKEENLSILKSLAKDEEGLKIECVINEKAPVEESERK